jgi:hypothetical protein
MTTDEKKVYIYTDPYGRSWTKKHLDETFVMIKNLKENLKEIIDYY